MPQVAHFDGLAADPSGEVFGQVWTWTQRGWMHSNLGFLHAWVSGCSRVVWFHFGFQFCVRQPATMPTLPPLCGAVSVFLGDLISGCAARTLPQIAPLGDCHRCGSLVDRCHPFLRHPKPSTIGTLDAPHSPLQCKLKHEGTACVKCCLPSGQHLHHDQVFAWRRRSACSGRSRAATSLQELCVDLLLLLSTHRLSTEH